MGTVGPVGRREEFGRHTAMEIHGRVYLNGHHMSDMTFDEVCGVARYRAETEPEPNTYTKVDTGRFVWAVALSAGVLFVLLTGMALSWGN